MNLKKETRNAQGSKSEDSTAEPETAVPETAAVHGLTSESVLLAKLKQVRNAVKTDSPDAGGKTASDEWSPAHHTIATEAKPPDIGAAAVVVLTQKNEENNRIVNDLLKQDIGDIPVVEDHTTGPLLAAPIPEGAAPGLLVATPTHAVVTLTHPISDTSSINSTNVGPAVVPLVSGDIAAAAAVLPLLAAPIPELAAAAAALPLLAAPIPEGAAPTHAVAVPELAAAAAALPLLAAPIPAAAAAALPLLAAPIPEGAAPTHAVAAPELAAAAATLPLLAAPIPEGAAPTHVVATLTHPISDTSSINSTNVGPAVVPLVSGDIVALTHEVAVPEPAAPAAAHLAALSLKVATPPVPALTHKLAVPEPAADAAAHLAALSLKVATPPVPALTHKLAVPEPTADAAAHLAALSLKVATPPVQALTPKSVVPEVAAHPAPLTHPNSDKSLIDSTDVGPAVAPVVIHEPNQDDLDRLMNELY